MAVRHRRLDGEERGRMSKGSSGPSAVAENCELIKVPQRPSGHGSDLA